MDKKNILKSMINGGKTALSVATNPAAAAYKGVQGARKAVKSSLSGMRTLGKKPSIADMPTLKGGKGAYVSPNNKSVDDTMLVNSRLKEKDRTYNNLKADDTWEIKNRMLVKKAIAKKLKVPTPGNASPAFKELKQKSVDLKYK
jgi:hypothetical protein